jgi:hypothetical protein
VKLALLILLSALPLRADPFEAALEDAAASARAARDAAAKEKKRRVFPLVAMPILPGEMSAPLLLDVPLSELRDGPLGAVTADISGRTWKVGVTADPGWDDFYLVLSSGEDRLLAPLSPLGRFLADEGVVVSDEDGPVLRFNARISLLHPINGTTVIAVDAENARAGKDSFTVGELVEKLKATGRVFRAGSTELHVFSLTEALEGGAALSNERTLVFARLAGTKTRAWSVRESALAPGLPVRAEIAGRIVVILKTTDGRLVVRDAGAAPKR